MVRGLDIFREHFAPFTDQYVLIGGTAATLAMADAGLDFRATKDLDIVLHIEALSPDFGAAFWAELLPAERPYLVKAPAPKLGLTRGEL